MKKIFSLTLIALCIFMSGCGIKVDWSLKSNSCEGLSKNKCEKNKKCEAMYGPSSCSMKSIGSNYEESCTMDIAYKGCRTK